MSEKEKGKSNPFAAYIRPTEDLLWQSPERVSETAGLLPKFDLYTVAAVGVFLILFGIIIAVAQDSTDNTGSPAAAATSIGIFGFMVRYWLRFSRRRAKRSETSGAIYDTRARYAVTSERLFYDRGYDLQAESLDNISVINVLPNNTLSFGAVFPLWGGLDDAEQVKSIIEQAQKERVKEKSA